MTPLKAIQSIALSQIQGGKIYPKTGFVLFVMLPRLYSWDIKRDKVQASSTNIV
jgi:hypothetical protein